MAGSCKLIELAEHDFRGDEHDFQTNVGGRSHVLIDPCDFEDVVGDIHDSVIQ
jgi:hypothetical protein